MPECNTTFISLIPGHRTHTPAIVAVVSQSDDELTRINSVSVVNAIATSRKNVRVFACELRMRNGKSEPCCFAELQLAKTLRVDGFHSIFSLGNWRALHHHAPC